MKWVIPVFVLTILASIPNDVEAQPYRRRLDGTSLNVIDITYGGTGLYISGNYSRKVQVKRYYFLNASLGTGTIIGLGGVTIPHQFTFNYGRQFNYLEAGLGGSFWAKSGQDEKWLFSYSISPIMGYRRNLLNDFVFRVYANPLLRLAGEYFYSDLVIVPYAGISLGYSF